MYYLCAELMQTASALLTRAAAGHHPPPRLRVGGADFHLGCVTLNPGTAPVHMGAHGPMKPNGRHRPQVARRKRLPQVKDLKCLWGRDHKKNEEIEQWLPAAAAAGCEDGAERQAKLATHWSACSPSHEMLQTAAPKEVMNVVFLDVAPWNASHILS